MEPSTCPFLGLKTDPTTSLSFASQGNYCHHARPVAPISREHQKKYCLSKDYHSCTIYNRDNAIPLPLLIYSHEHRRNIIEKISQVISIVVLLFYTVYMTMMWWNSSGLALYNSTDFRGVSTEDVGDLVSSPLPSQQLFTDSAVSDPNATLSDGFLLTTPESTVSPVESCTPPDGWISYTVQPTDSLLRLSLILGISVADIRTANCFSENEVVHSGQVVYIPPTPTITPTPTPTMTPTIPPRLPTLTYTPKPTVKKPKPSTSTPKPTQKPTQKPPTPTSIPPTVPPTKTSEPTPTLAPPNE